MYVLPICRGLDQELCQDPPMAVNYTCYVLTSACRVYSRDTLEIVVKTKIALISLVSVYFIYACVVSMCHSELFIL